MQSLRCMEVTLREWSLLLLLLSSSISLAQFQSVASSQEKCKKQGYRVRIVGGDTAPEGRYPYMCALYTNGFQFACGGILIHRNWVLTAAHCVDPKNSEAAYNGRVLCGVHNIDKDFDADHAFIPTRTYRHPKYNDSDVSQGYDIALLEFREGFHLPTPKLDLGRLCEFLPGQQFAALGWGSEKSDGKPKDELQQATTLQIFDHGQCSALLGLRVKSHHLCAGSDQDTCSGDSGGPLLESHRPRGRIDEGSPEKDIIIGITSFGGETCGTKKPGVYIKLSSFRHWIYKTTNKQVKKIAGKCRKDAQTKIRQTMLKEEQRDKTMQHRIWMMSVAIENDDADLVEVLLDLKVDPNGLYEEEHFLHLAAKHNAKESAKVLIGYRANISIEDREGRTPLMLASLYGQRAVLGVLLENNVPADMQDEDGYTASHHAAIAGYALIMKDLINYGADVNIGDEKEWTPLHYAASKGYVDIVKSLVDACADTTLISEIGEKPEDVTCHPPTCTIEESRKIIEYLTQK